MHIAHELLTRTRSRPSPIGWNRQIGTKLAQTSGTRQLADEDTSAKVPQVSDGCVGLRQLIIKIRRRSADASLFQHIFISWPYLAVGTFAGGGGLGTGTLLFTLRRLRQ